MLNLIETIAKHKLGIVDYQQLPSIAADALESGYDSPSIRCLAGSSGLEPSELQRLFLNALSELQLKVPTADEAGLLVAKGIAEAVLAGALRPYDGAKQIWSTIYTRLPELQQLRPLVGFASEFEDDESHREEYARLIFEECKAIVATK
jgi:hypothetical protein